MSEQPPGPVEPEGTVEPAPEPQELPDGVVGVVTMRAEATVTHPDGSEE
jgi:hypothetical protein